MPTSLPPDNLDDKQIRQHMVPVANVNQAWPIAHIDAYREIAPSLVELHDSLSAASGQSLFPAAIQTKVMDVLNRISDLTQKRWEEYVRAAAQNPLHADSLRDSGVPEHITYDSMNGVPFLTWLSVMDGPQLNWRQIHINILEDTSGQSFVLTPPFRPVRVENLPADTRKLMITDQVHAATIAVSEVIDAALADLLRAKNQVSARDNWVRMRMTANFYASIVQERMKELALDDYKDWVVTLPAQIPILNAPAVIARHASNAVVIQVLAMRTIAHFILDAMDRAEKEPGNTDQGMVVDQVIDEMTAYRDRMQARAQSLNDLLVSEAQNLPPAYAVQVITRPFPRGTPFIAIIPEHPSGAAAQVVPLRDPSDPDPAC